MNNHFSSLIKLLICFKNWGATEAPKGEPSKKDPPTCFECHKPGHYNSEGSKSEQEESDNEMANFCLMAKEDEVSFSNIESNDELYSYEELQDAYDELCENTIKLHAKYTTLKKKEMGLGNEVVTLKDKNENLLKDINNLTFKIKSSIALEEENTRLKETIKDLTKTLANFVNGKKNLDMLLGRQMCVFNKEGLGYTPENKQKFYKNFFVKEFCANSSFTTCKSCGRN